MELSIVPERPDTPDATALILELEEHLAARYPAASRHGFSVQKLIDQGVAFFVLRADGKPAGCGGILFVGKEFGELKRMYVRPEYRGQRLGERLLEHLQAYALENGFTVLRLETGTQQDAAIRMYERFGFYRISPFPPYFEDPLSRCYEKKID